MREKSAAAVLKSRSIGCCTKCCPKIEAAKSELDGQKNTKETSLAAGQIKIFFDATREGERGEENEAAVSFHLVAMWANFCLE